MTEALLKIKENIEKIRFQIIIGNIFNKRIEGYINEIIQNFNSNKWFFSDVDIKPIKDIKNSIQKFNADKKKVINSNVITIPITVKNISIILNRNIKPNQNKYNTYLKECLTPKYKTKLLNDEHIIRKLNLFGKKLLNAESHYKNIVSNIIERDGSINSRNKQRIETLLPLIEIGKKDFQEYISAYSEKKIDKHKLIENLTKLISRKIYNYYIPIYNVKDDDVLKLNKYVEIITIRDFRKKYSKYLGYDYFIDSMGILLFQKDIKLLHLKFSCRGDESSFVVLSKYYELFIDIVAFFQSGLTFKFNDSGDRFRYYKIHNNKSIGGGFHESGTITEFLELSSQTKENFKVFNFLFSAKQTAISNKIQNSIKYLRKAKISIFNEDKLLDYIISLEALTIDSSDWGNNKPKHEIIIGRVSKFIKYYPEFQELPQNIEKYYLMRHQIVHTGRFYVDIDDNDFKYLERTIWKLIAYFLRFNKAKSLSTMIKTIEKQYKDRYNLEKKRLVEQGIKFNKEYIFSGKVIQNNSPLCNVNAKLSFKDHEKSSLIDVIISDLKCTDTLKSLSSRGIDIFYLEGKFSKFRLDRTQLNLSLTDIFAEKFSKFVVQNNRKQARLLSSSNIFSEGKNAI